MEARTATDESQSLEEILKQLVELVENGYGFSDEEIAKVEQLQALADEAQRRQ